VPAGTPPAQPRVPADLVGTDRLPQGEVAGVLLVVLVGVDAAARSGDQPGGPGPAEPPVGGEVGDVEVDAAIAAVGDTLCVEPLDEVDHLVDVLGGTRVLVGAAQVEGVDVLEEALDPGPGLLVEGVVRRGRVADDLVLDVGEVHHVGDRGETLF